MHIEIDSSRTSLVSVTGSASLAGTLEIELDPNAQPGTYTILTSSGITGTFDAITFTRNYAELFTLVSTDRNPTFVQFDFLGYPPTPPTIVQPASHFQGKQKKNNFGFEYELYNQLTWTPSPSPTLSGYYLSDNDNRIATLSASATTYQDHNRPRGVLSVYSLVAFDDNGTTSSPVTVTVSGK